MVPLFSESTVSLSVSETAARFCGSTPWLEPARFNSRLMFLVAEWIHFTLFGIILPTTKPKVFLGAYELSN